MRSVMVSIFGSVMGSVVVSNIGSVMGLVIWLVMESTMRLVVKWGRSWDCSRYVLCHKSHLLCQNYNVAVSELVSTRVRYRSARKAKYSCIVQDHVNSFSAAISWKIQNAKDNPAT